MAKVISTLNIKTGEITRTFIEYPEGNHDISDLFITLDSCGIFDRIYDFALGKIQLEFDENPSS